MTRNYRIALAALGFVALEVLLVAFIDKPLSQYLRTVDTAHPAVIDFFRAYTDFGQSRWYLWSAAAGIALCVFFIRTKSLSGATRTRIQNIGNRLAFLFVGVAVSGIVTDIIKIIIGRARPVMMVRQSFYGFHPMAFDAAWKSMPSGHATTAFALVFILAGFFPRWRSLIWAAGIALAASRVMVNAHFLSDVIAGGAVAWITVTLLRQVLTRYGKFLFERVFFPLTAYAREE